MEHSKGALWAAVPYRGDALQGHNHCSGLLLGLRFVIVVQSLPLLLLTEEMQLLKEKGLVRLVEFPCLEKEPVEAVKREYQEYREKNYQEQVELYKEERKTQILEMADKIVEGKKRKMVERIKNKRKYHKMRLEAEVKEKRGDGGEEQVVVLSSDEEAEEEPEGLVKIDKDSVISQEIAKIRPINRNQALVQIFTRHPWLTDNDR